MAFEPRHLNLQFNAALTDRDGLMLEQSECVDLSFIGATPRHFIQRVLQPLPFAGHLFLARPQLRQPIRLVRDSMVARSRFVLSAVWPESPSTFS